MEIHQTSVMVITVRDAVTMGGAGISEYQIRSRTRKGMVTDERSFQF